MVGFVGERLESANCATRFHVGWWLSAPVAFREIDGRAAFRTNGVDQRHLPRKRSTRSRKKSCPRAPSWLWHGRDFVSARESCLSRSLIFSLYLAGAAKSICCFGDASHVCITR